jgi:hypothetical protein
LKDVNFAGEHLAPDLWAGLAPAVFGHGNAVHDHRRPPRRGIARPARSDKARPADLDYRPDLTIDLEPYTVAVIEIRAR